MKLGDLAIPTLLALGALFGKYLGELLNRLALPGRNLRRMQFVVGRQLRNRVSWPLIASSASSWWIILCIGESTLAGCVRKWDHL